MRMRTRLFLSMALVLCVLSGNLAQAAAAETDFDVLLRSESGARGQSAYTSYPGLGLEFNYPGEVRLADPEQGAVDPEQYALSIVVEPLAALEPGADVLPEESREAAVKERAALAKGQPGEETADEYVEGTLKVVALPNGPAAKTFTVLGRYEVCDVTFERIAVLYWRDCRITLRLSGPRAAITRENQDLFFRDPDNCGEELIWNFEAGAQAQFIQKLQSGQAGEHAARWNELFAEILRNIRFAGQAASGVSGVSGVSDPRICRRAAEKLAQRSSGIRPLPERSLAVRLPHFGDVCLLVAEVGKEKGEMLYLVPGQADFLENLALAPNCRGRIKGLKAVHLNQDGFPEFLVLADCSTALVPEAGNSGNRVFWSLSNDLGVEWLADGQMCAAVKDAASLEAMEAAIRGYLAALNKDAGKIIRLKGRFSKQEDQLLFQTEGQAPDIAYEILSVPKGFAVQCRGHYDQPGEIEAKVRRVERLQGLSHVQLELRACL